MSSDDRDRIGEAHDALDAALDEVAGLDCTALTTRECLRLLERLERLRRRLPVAEHPLVNRVVTGASPDGLGARPDWVIADGLRISRSAARRRIAEAGEIDDRITVSGQPMPPMLEAVAAAQRAGAIGGEHIAVIREFFDYIPAAIDPDTRRTAEAQLVSLAGQMRPEQLRGVAAQLADYLHPDGELDDAERARRRGVALGRQGRDGMSRITGWLTPEARATLDAVLARWAAPGMCNPDDDTPVTDGAPAQEAIRADRRGGGQRNHDAIVAMGRAMLASGQLGQHNGLPASIIVSTTLAELRTAADSSACGSVTKAHTGGGTWLPLRDVLRLAAHAHHYLRIHDGAKEIALYHRRRLAAPGQRIVLHARDRGCSAPGCGVPGYLCEAHHVDDYAGSGDTGIDNLTFACGPHHRTIRPGGYRTRRNHRGDVEWLPPPHHDQHRHAHRVNRYHHPERLLREAQNSAGRDP